MRVKMVRGLGVGVRVLWWTMCFCREVGLIRSSILVFDFELGLKYSPRLHGSLGSLVLKCSLWYVGGRRFKV